MILKMLAVRIIQYEKSFLLLELFRVFRVPSIKLCSRIRVDSINQNNLSRNPALASDISFTIAGAIPADKKHIPKNVYSMIGHFDIT